MKSLLRLKNLQHMISITAVEKTRIARDVNAEILLGIRHDTIAVSRSTRVNEAELREDLRDMPLAHDGVRSRCLQCSPGGNGRVLPPFEIIAKQECGPRLRRRAVFVARARLNKACKAVEGGRYD